MGTTKTRQYKISWMWGHIQAAANQEKILDKELLIAKFCLDLASSRKTAVEILKGFEATGKIKIIGKELWTPERYDIEQSLNNQKK